MIFTDHKPLIFAFHQKLDKASSYQARNLDPIAQFSTDIRYVTGKDNIAADAFSRIEEVSKSMDYAAIPRAQQDDKELKLLLASSVHSSKRI